LTGQLVAVVAVQVVPHLRGMVGLEAEAEANKTLMERVYEQVMVVYLVVVVGQIPMVVADHQIIMVLEGGAEHMVAVAERL
jgi:hypothetical protein